MSVLLAAREDTLVAKFVRRYPLWTILGFLIVLSTVLGLMPYRVLNEQTLLTEEFAGRTTSPAFRSALGTETALDRFIEQYLVLGLGFIKLGIGFAVATIVRHLRATAVKAVGQLAAVGVETPAPEQLKLPWFARLFERLLLAGWIIEILLVVPFTVIWILNGVNVLQLRFAGLASTAAYQQALTFDFLFEHLIKPGKFIGAAFLFTGIAFGLATIVTNARLQAYLLPNLLGVVFGRSQVSGSEFGLPARLSSIIPRRDLWIVAIGAAITISAFFPLATVRSAFRLTMLGEEFAGRVGSAAFQSAAVSQVVTEHLLTTWIFVGIAVIIAGINFWLYHIVRNLRLNRLNFGRLFTAVTGLEAPPIEKSLWTMKAVPVAVIVGLAIVFYTFFPVTVIWAQSGATVLGEQFAGRAGSSVQQTAILTETFLDHATKPFKFVGLAALLLGVGFNLLNISVNLRLMSLLLVSGLGKLLAIKAGGGAGQGGTATGSTPSVLVETPRPLSVAPWLPFAVIAVGVAIVVFVNFPLAYLRILSAEGFLRESFAGRTASAVFQAAFATDRILEHIILPVKLFGIGLILFTIQKWFSGARILGFVKARRVVVGEAFESLAIYVKQAAKPA